MIQSPSKYYLGLGQTRRNLRLRYGSTVIGSSMQGQHHKKSINFGSEGTANGAILRQSPKQWRGQDRISGG